MVIQTLTHPASWGWAPALIALLIICVPIGIFAARIESWHQRRARQRSASAWADPARRVRFAQQDFRSRGIRHGE